MMTRTLALVLAVLTPATAAATVTTTTRSVTYSPSGPTTTFVVTYPFIRKDDLTVTKILDADGSETTLIRCAGSGTSGCDYVVTLPIGGSNGYISTTASITTTHSIRIDRTVSLKQLTAFRSQGRYRAHTHEDAFDRVYMALQQINAAAGTSGDSAVATHEGLSDPHTQYFLLNGRSGGQVGYGDTAASGNLTLHSTSHTTRGSIFLGNSNELVVDDANGAVGIGGVPTGSYTLEVTGDMWLSANSDIYGVNGLTLYGDTASGGNLYLGSTYHATKGKIYLGAQGYSVYDETNKRLGIGTASPSGALEAVGSVYVGDSESDYQLQITSNNTVGTRMYANHAAEDSAFCIYGGPSTGTNLPVLCLWGTSHATYPGQASLHGGPVVLYTESGTEVASFDYPDSTTNSTLASRQAWESVSTNDTVDEDTDCNKVWYASAGLTLSLPDADTTAAVGGCTITVIVAAAISVTISPDTDDGIEGYCTQATTGTTPAVGASTGADIYHFTGVNNKDAVMTTSVGHESIVMSAINGDWHVTACYGEWTSEP